MLWVTARGLCALPHSLRKALVTLGRNMSCSCEVKPVTVLGTMAFGGRADAEQSREMVKTFLGRGHKHLDTAFMYMDGKSEAIIGDMELPKAGTLTPLC